MKKFALFLILIAMFLATGPPSAFAKKRNTFFTLGSGLTYTRYTEGTAADLDQVSVTPKLTVTQFLGRKSGWNLGMTAFYNGAYIVKSSRSDPANFLGVNVRFGYASRKKRKKFAIDIYTGGYYITMLVASKAYGFENMMGPQLFPVIRNQFKRFRIMTYGKYSPVTNKKGLLPFKNYEVAAGTSFGFRVGRRSWFSVTFDASKLQLIIDGVQVRAQTLTGGLSLTF